MYKYSDKRELAPRDVVTRAIYTEMGKDNANSVYLNASIINPDRLLNRFPTISSKCIDNGIDISKNPIPVAPAAHYTMGGIKADITGKTSIKGLFAIGETASTGLHGANRLASNSLLECVVCAYELADYLSFTNLSTPKKIDENIKKMIDVYSRSIYGKPYDTKKLKADLKDIMWKYVGIIRNEESLNKAKCMVDSLKQDFKRLRKCLTLDEYEYRNMLTVASIIIEGALNRKESRGAHSRSDFKQSDKQCSHSVFTKNIERSLTHAG